MGIYSRASEQVVMGTYSDPGLRTSGNGDLFSPSGHLRCIAMCKNQVLMGSYSQQGSNGILTLLAVLFMRLLLRIVDNERTLNNITAILLYIYFLYNITKVLYHMHMTS